MRSIGRVAAVAVLAALVSGLSAPGAAGQDDGAVDAAGSGSLIDRWADEASNALHEIDAELARLEAWIADEDIVVVRSRDGLEPVPRGELEALMPAMATLVLASAESRSSLDISTLLTLARTFLTTTGAAGLPLPDGVTLEQLQAEAGYFTALVAAAEPLHIERRRAELERDRAAIIEFVGVLEAYEDEVLAGGGSAPAVSTIDAVIANPGGPYTERCLWDTGTFVDREHLDNMRVIAWKHAALNGAGGPWFSFAVAWPDPDHPDPNWMLDRQEQYVADRLADGTLIYRGTPEGLCLLARSTCPGQPPPLCPDLPGP